LPEDLQAQLPLSARPVTSIPAPAQNLQALSRAVIAATIENCQGNISQASRLLGISRQTVYRTLARERMGKPIMG